MTHIPANVKNEILKLPRFHFCALRPGHEKTPRYVEVELKPDSFSTGILVFEGLPITEKGQHLIIAHIGTVGYHCNMHDLAREILSGKGSFDLHAYCMTNNTLMNSVLGANYREAQWIEGTLRNLHHTQIIGGASQNLRGPDTLCFDFDPAQRDKDRWAPYEPYWFRYVRPITQPQRIVYSPREIQEQKTHIQQCAQGKTARLRELVLAG